MSASASVLPIRISQPRKITLGPAAPRPTAFTPGFLEREVEAYVSRERAIEVGVWEGSVGAFPAKRDGYTEICQILGGRATLHTTGGEPVELQAGDTIVMPSGWVGRWELHEDLRKLYIIVYDRAG